MSGKPDDDANDGAAPPSYDRFLALDRLLALQQPITGAHDELLFLVQHQTTELWFKVLLHELTSARDCLAAGDIGTACRRIDRGRRIVQHLNGAWPVLSSLDPAAFAGFRQALGGSSGLQSANWRALEVLLGNRGEPKRGDGKPAAASQLLDQLRGEASLYDAARACLARAGFTIAPAVLRHAPYGSTTPDAGVLAAWIAVYRDPTTYGDLHRLAEDLLDLEDTLRTWRFKHVLVVERLIGRKSGTGGTSGAGYLRGLLELVLFPELRELRDRL